MKIKVRVKSIRKIREQKGLLEVKNGEDKLIFFRNGNKLRELKEQVYIDIDLTNRER